MYYNISNNETIWIKTLIIRSFISKNQGKALALHELGWKSRENAFISAG